MDKNSPELADIRPSEEGKLLLTPPQIRARVEALAPWFHCIDLGEGILTKTASVTGEADDHPRGTWEKIQRCLPQDLSGRTVLDVGCNAGFYAVEAKRRGAARVLGVDSQRHLINQAIFVRRALGLDIEYRRMSVYDLSRSSVGHFDITLALGLIYHCKHLVLALEKLFEVTNDLLIIETAMLPEEKTPESFVDQVAGPSVTLHPLAYADNSVETKEPVFNWFLPGAQALAALLRNVGFGEVSFFDQQPGRAVVVCRKTQSSSGPVVLSQFYASLRLEAGPTISLAGAHMDFRVIVQNTGAARWTAAAKGSDRGVVRLGAHLLGIDEEVVIWDYWRADLPSDLAPDESATIDIALRAPDTPGNYLVEFDMVIERLSWFEDLGTQTVRGRIEVK
jgi:tRNA (mo5U34)-methyltransferase